MTDLKKTALQAALVLLVSFLLFTADVTKASGQTDPLLKIRGQRISVHAVSTPVDFLLGALARQSGIEVFIHGKSDGLITTDMQNTPIEEGIKRLLKGYNIALTYGVNDKGTAFITRLYVYTQAGTGDLSPIIPEATIIDTRPTHRGPAEGIVIRTDTPQESDPLYSMQAIDPLMRINQVKASYQPVNYHKESGPAVGPYEILNNDEPLYDDRQVRKRSGE